MRRYQKIIASAVLSAAILISVISPASAFLYSEMTSLLSVEGYEITTVAPETRHITLRASDSSGHQNINAVEFNPQNPYTQLRAGLSAGYVYSVQTVNTIANNMSDTNGGDTAVAAVNGDFFTFGVGVPHGVFIDEGKILTTPPQYYAAFGLTYDNKPFIVRHGTILDKIFRIDGALVDVAGINLPHVKNADSLVLYTADYARGTKTGTETYELRCRLNSGEVRHGGTINFTVEEIHNAEGNTALGDGYIVLSAQGARMNDLKKLSIGDTLEMSFRFNEFWSNVKFAVGGIELLLKDGNVYSTTDASNQPRTSIGIRADGTVVMATIDGRQKDAVGMSYKSAAQAMKALGCVDALNLDGGGSTTFVLRNPGDMKTSVVNKVSGSSPRQVANAIVLMNTAPTGAAKTLNITPKNTLMLAGSTVNLSVSGAYDENYKPVAVPGFVSWSVADSLGSIDENGNFTAVSSGVSTVTAASETAQGTAKIEIAPYITAIYPNKTSVTAKAGETVSLDATAYYNGRKVTANKSLFTWSAPESLGTFTSAGEFRLSDNPTSGKITVSYGSVSAEISVETSVPPVTISDFETDDTVFTPVSIGTKTAPNCKFETESDMVMYGRRSLKIYYNFLNTEGSVGSYYMVSPDSANASAYHLKTAPKKLSMYAYGDGSGASLKCLVEDSSGKQYVLSYTNPNGVDWKGWKYVEAELPEGIEGPVYVKVPVYLVSNPQKKTHGCMYFDRLRAVYSDNSDEDHAMPEITKAWPSENMVIYTRKPSVGVILRDDSATNIGAGINPDTVEIWINGYNCTDRTFDTVTGKISYTVKHNLKNGKHTILVRAKDYYGNPLIREWTFEVRV